MATGTLLPMPWWAPLDDVGLIMPGAKLSFFLSGTSTPAVVYHDADLTSPWTQPAIVDAFGRIVIYTDPATGNLKLMFTDANDVPVGPTVDPISPTNLGASGGVGSTAFDFGSNSSANVTVTTYPTGALFSALQPGSLVWLVDPGTLTGGYALNVMGVMTGAGTLTVGLFNLDGGSPDVPLATCAITSLTGELVQSAVITFPPGGTPINFGIKAQVSASDGFVIGAFISRIT
jgi:hypothetical protein